MPTLDWIGKNAVRGHHRTVPYHLLKCDKELSIGDPDSGNLRVQGGKTCWRSKRCCRIATVVRARPRFAGAFAD